MDYRFKISGDTQPFNVKLYEGASALPLFLVKQIAVEYSGTCAIMNNLKENTTYTLSVFDGVEKNTINSFTTNCQATPSIPQVVNFGLLGTEFKPTGPPTGTVCTLNGMFPKLMEILPTLSALDCATINTSVVITNPSGEVYSDVKLYKSCNGGSYSQFANYSSNGVYTPSIDMGQNDSICYDMSSVFSGSIVAGTYYGCADIVLNSVSSVGGTFIPNVDVANSAVTTNINYVVVPVLPPTTAGPPTKISLSQTNLGIVNGTLEILGNLIATPPLVEGQSFEMCFTNTSHSCSNQYSGHESCANTISSIVHTNYGETEAILPANSYDGDVEDNCYTSIIVDSVNIGLVSIDLCAYINIDDSAFTMISEATFEFNRFDKQLGGNYEWDGTKIMRAYRDTDLVLLPPPPHGGPTPLLPPPPHGAPPPVEP